MCGAEHGHCLWAWEHLGDLPVQGSKGTGLASVTARSGSFSWQTVNSAAVGVGVGIWAWATFSRMLASALSQSSWCTEDAPKAAMTCHRGGGNQSCSARRGARLGQRGDLWPEGCDGTCGCHVWGGAQHFVLKPPPQTQACGTSITHSA